MAVTYEGETEQARQVIHHHAVLRRGLERRVGTLCEAVECGTPFERQMTILRDYLVGEILSHAEAEERTLYRAAATQTRGSELVRELTVEHHALAYLAGRLRVGADGGQAATAAEWIATLFAGHVAKVHDLLLPALTGSGADLAALLTDMHTPQPSVRALRHWHRPHRRAGTRPGSVTIRGPGTATDRLRTATRRTWPHDHLEV